jgi:hypothetical protein
MKAKSIAYEDLATDTYTVTFERGGRLLVDENEVPVTIIIKRSLVGLSPELMKSANKQIQRILRSMEILDENIQPSGSTVILEGSWVSDRKSK